MKEKTVLVAACGLYCGACKRYLQEKCPGCSDNQKASWCKIRSCVAANNISTCSECSDFADVNECKKFNNIFSKFFYYVFRSDRKASLQRISEVGLTSYAEEMDAQNIPVIKRQ